MSPRDHRLEETRTVRIPATPDGRGGWVPHVDQVALGPGWVVEPDLAHPDPREHTHFDQLGNVERLVTTIRGCAVRRV